MLNWEFLHPQATLYHVGYIGETLSEGNPKSAAEQITAIYPFGGWQASSIGSKIRILADNAYQFPGDPVQKPIARAKLRDEVICVYQSEFWIIFQPDGKFEICRLD